MKPKTIILMVVAVVCGLGASYMTSRLLAERQNQSQEAEKVNVVVAKKDLEIGVGIKDKNLVHLFELKEFEKGNEPKNALSSLDQLKDKYLKRNLRKGDFVTPEDIVEDFSALTLPDGKQAMSVRVNMETGVSGFATLPGSHVDLLWFERTGRDAETQCWTLLEDVLVLAADTAAQRTGDKTAMPASTVTLALTPEETRKVALASETGQLRLALRRPDDKRKVSERVTTLKQLKKELAIGDEEESPQVAQEPPAPAPVEPKQEEPPQPVVRPYLVDIVIGDRTRTKQYLQDKEGRILRPGEVVEPQREPAPQPEADPAIPQVQPGEQQNPQPPAAPGSGNKDV